MLYKCESCNERYGQAEAERVFLATSQETICQECASNYWAYSRMYGTFVEFDDTGDEVVFAEWTIAERKLADRFATKFCCGWPLICE